MDLEIKSNERLNGEWIPYNSECWHCWISYRNLCDDCKTIYLLMMAGF